MFFVHLWFDVMGSTGTVSQALVVRMLFWGALLLLPGGGFLLFAYGFAKAVRAQREETAATLWSAVSHVDLGRVWRETRAVARF